jgi:uncharacterized coiled-coil protein SlyX
MNVLSDFEIRINRICPVTEENIEILKLNSQIREQDEIIAKQTSELDSLNKRLSKIKTNPKTKTKATTPKPDKSARRKVIPKTRSGGIRKKAAK